MRQTSCIGGGTTEMARNVISERVLGMPRERSHDPSLPFRDVPRSASSARRSEQLGSRVFRTGARDLRRAGDRVDGEAVVAAAVAHLDPAEPVVHLCRRYRRPDPHRTQVAHRER